MSLSMTHTDRPDSQLMQPVSLTFDLDDWYVDGDAGAEHITEAMRMVAGPSTTILLSGGTGERAHVGPTSSAADNLPLIARREVPTPQTKARLEQMLMALIADAQIRYGVDLSWFCIEHPDHIAG